MIFSLLFGGNDGYFLIHTYLYEGVFQNTQVSFSTLFYSLILHTHISLFSSPILLLEKHVQINYVHYIDHLISEIVNLYLKLYFHML